MTQLARYLRWTIGVMFLGGGIAKFLPWPEDPYATLSAGHAANKGTWIEPLSKIAFAHAPIIIPLIGITMTLSGLAQLSGTMVRAAGLAQLALMTCFVLILHRAFPAVILVDGVMALTIVFGIWRTEI